MRKNKIKKAIIALIFLNLTILCAVYFLVIKPKQNVLSNQANMAIRKEAEVIVITVKKDKVQLFQELPARVEAFKISEVRPQAEGIIKKRLFVEGSFVKAGQVLYQIDPTIYQASYENSSANLKNLRTKKLRYEKLLEVDAISKQEFDDLETSLAQAESEAKKTKATLNYTKVYAPISGYIGKSNFTEGALVTANQNGVLTTITQLDPIYVDMAQPAKEALETNNKKEILVSLVSDDPNYQNIGKLKLIENFADQTTDSVRLRAVFSNKDKKLIPGMFIGAKLHLEPIKAITVPQKATTRMPDGSLSVWIIDKENIAKMRIIKANQTFGDNWVVESGLEDGEIVVLEGFLKISEGAKVKTTKPENQIQKN